MRDNWRTDKPPDEREKYLVQLKSPVGYMMICEWTNTYYFTREVMGEWHWNGLPQYTSQEDVIAWRLLPEPYDTRRKARRVNYGGEDEARCPQCGYKLNELPGYKNLKLFEEEYCPCCGQRLDW